jgi:hypothetical protein
MIRRPSITWKMPLRTMRSGSFPLLAAEYDVAARDLAVLGFQQARNGLQGGRFAGAVGAEQRHDLTLSDVQAETAEHEDDVVVDDLDIVDREQRRRRGRDGRRGRMSSLRTGRHRIRHAAPLQVP